MDGKPNGGSAVQIVVAGKPGGGMDRRYLPLTRPGAGFYICESALRARRVRGRKRGKESVKAVLPATDPHGDDDER